MQPFSKKKIYKKLIKEICNFKATAKIICLFFYSNFVFSKLKVANMAHNELPFILPVFGTALTSKMLKNLMWFKKNYWD